MRYYNMNNNEIFAIVWTYREVYKYLSLKISI